MSRWRALAAARDVADADLRDRLVDALETIHVVADALNGSHEDVRCESTHESAVLEAIHELQGLANSDGAPDVEAECEEFERRAERAEERLEPSLQRIRELEEKVAMLERHTAVLTEEAIARQPMLDAYADLLARARAFVAFAEKSGVKATHCRAVPGTGTPAKDKSAARRKGRKSW